LHHVPKWPQTCFLSEQFQSRRMSLSIPSLQQGIELGQNDGQEPIYTENNVNQTKTYSLIAMGKSRSTVYSLYVSLPSR
jgi:hypothetical protein